MEDELALVDELELLVDDDVLDEVELLVDADEDADELLLDEEELLDDELLEDEPPLPPCPIFEQASSASGPLTHLPAKHVTLSSPRQTLMQS